jgi:anti-sigma factor RsiW
MNCERYAEAIDDLVDGRLEDVARLELEAHLAGCVSCRALVADLRSIRDTAAALPVHHPPERVWTRLAADLPAAAPVPSVAAPRPSPAQAEPRASWLPKMFGGPGWRLAWGAAATIALAAVLLVLLLPRVRPAGQGQPVAKAPASSPAASPADQVHPSNADLVQSVESELQMAEQHYEKAIAGLEQIAKAGEGTLDPQVASTLRKNLGVIDQAIHDSRVALQAQPTNELAQESLFDAFRRKVGLLQDTVTLINEMRKGNQAEAAKIIGNMQKS